jgi:hypothetical protein
MKRALRLLILAASLAALVAAALAAGGLAKRAGSPFYLVPPLPTKECNKVKACVHVVGPWIAVPAKGEATFLLECPKRHGSVGGTDVRASSKHVHIWFDGQSGAPIMQGITTGPFLLFHAVTDDRKPGSFEPLLGCITIKQQTDIRSTVSARVGPAPSGTVEGPPIEPRARFVVLQAGTTVTRTKSCLKKEKLVGSWNALAFTSPGPPDLSHVHVVTTKTVSTGKTVSSTITAGRSLPFIPLAEVQIGAMCAP